MCEKKVLNFVFEKMTLKEDRVNLSLNVRFYSQIDIYELLKMSCFDKYYYEVKKIIVDYEEDIFIIYFTTITALKRFIREIERKS